MRNLVRVLLLISVFSLYSVSAYAQDEEAGEAFPPCSAEEMNDGMAVLSDLQQQIAATAADYDFTIDPSDENYPQIVATMDQFTTTVWQTNQDQLPACFEMRVAGYMAGEPYNQTLTSMLLKRAGVWSEEDADTYLEASVAHDDLVAQYGQMSLNITLDELSEIETCTDDDFDTLANIFADLHAEIGPQFLEYIGDSAYADLFSYTDEVAYNFATEVFPQISVCRENLVIAMALRASLDELNIGSGFLTVGQGEGQEDEAAWDMLSELGSAHFTTYTAQWQALASVLGVDIEFAPEAEADY